MDTGTLVIIGAVIVVGVLLVVWQQRQGVVKRPSGVEAATREKPHGWLKDVASKAPTNDWGDAVGLSQEQVAQINAEIVAGRKINAIKLFREFTRMGLKEAKDAVEAIERGQKPALSAYQSLLANQSAGDVIAKMEQELRAKRKINAIKVYRQAYNVGLQEAKDAVDEMERKLGM